MKMLRRIWFVHSQSSLVKIMKSCAKNCEVAYANCATSIVTVKTPQTETIHIDGYRNIFEIQNLSCVLLPFFESIQVRKKL